MIFGLKTEHTEVIDKFVEEFNNPSMAKAIITNSLYIEHKAEWIDNILVFRRKGAYDFIFKYGILLSLGVILFGVLSQYSWLITSGFISIFLFISILSPVVFYLSLGLRMLFKGHKKKITLVSNNYLLEKLFYERDKRNEVSTT